MIYALYMKLERTGLFLKNKEKKPVYNTLDAIF